MTGPMKDIETAWRTVRIVHFAVLLTIPIYGVVGEFTGPQDAKDVAWLQQILMVVAAASIVLMLLVRKHRVSPAEEALRLRPEEADSLGRWVLGNVASFALCQSVGVCGLVLRLLGGTLAQSLPFYVAAIGLLLLLWPRRPLT